MDAEKAMRAMLSRELTALRRAHRAGLTQAGEKGFVITLSRESEDAEWLATFASSEAKRAARFIDQLASEEP